LINTIPENYNCTFFHRKAESVVSATGDDISFCVKFFFSDGSHLLIESFLTTLKSEWFSIEVN